MKSHLNSNVFINKIKLGLILTYFHLLWNQKYCSGQFLIIFSILRLKISELARISLCLSSVCSSSSLSPIINSCLLKDNLRIYADTTGAFLRLQMVEREELVLAGFPKKSTYLSARFMLIQHNTDAFAFIYRFEYCSYSYSCRLFMNNFKTISSS